MNGKVDSGFGALAVHKIALSPDSNPAIADNKLMVSWANRSPLFAGADILPMGVAFQPTSQPTILRYGDRDMLNFGTNNYFGATQIPEVREAAHFAIDNYGVGATASRLAGGSTQQHLILEKKIADLFGMAGCIVFTTGYAANNGPLKVLAEKGVNIFLDAECHASIWDGVLKSDAGVYRFRHNNLEHLRKLLLRHGGSGRNIVCVEGLYSMSGSLAPLSDLVQLRREFGFFLMVDEAHSFGTIGKNGLGLAEELGVLKDIDIITGTFSKTTGAIGGFATFADPTLELLRFATPNYMYTAALPPPIVAAVTKAIEVVIENGQELRATLAANKRFMTESLNRLGIDVAEPPGPIINVPFPDSPTAVEKWYEVFERGLYVNLVLPPSSPAGMPMHRVSISVCHSEGEMTRAANILGDATKS
jgi:8-amino-7-oxononanoate synthase